MAFGSSEALLPKARGPRHPLISRAEATTESLVDDKATRMTKPKPRDGEDELVGAAALARRLGLVATSVSRLAAQGVLVKRGRGQYLIWASVRAYLAHRDKEAASRASPASVARAELLKVQSVNALFRTVRAGMLAAPGRIAAALPGLTREDALRIDDIIRASLTELAQTDPATLVRELAQVEAEKVRAR
jgi:hypothetical protein